jgi:hypothetical protein
MNQRFPVQKANFTTNTHILGFHHRDNSKAKIQEQEQIERNESIEHTIGEKLRYVFLVPHEAKDMIDSTQNNHRRQKCDTADKDNVDLGHGVGSYGGLPGK